MQYALLKRIVFLRLNETREVGKLALKIYLSFFEKLVSEPRPWSIFLNDSTLTSR